MRVTYCSVNICDTYQIVMILRNSSTGAANFFSFYSYLLSEKLTRLAISKNQKKKNNLSILHCPLLEHFVCESLVTCISAYFLQTWLNRTDQHLASKCFHQLLPLISWFWNCIYKIPIECGIVFWLVLWCMLMYVSSRIIPNPTLAP